MSENIIRLSDGDSNGHLSSGKISIIKKIDMFMCPVCGSRMHIKDSNSIACLNNHCFDISKKGYVNLLLNCKKSRYDRKMFESRKIICRSGFFNPVIECITNLVVKEGCKAKSSSTRILDAGCGEGSNLASVIDSMSSKVYGDWVAAGIDISREGIQIASREYPDNIWCVADLSRIPFMDGQFDVVLNMLTPSNYGEFERVIAGNGLLIKVIPGSKYLNELRSFFYNSTDKQTYSNERVIRHFGRNFNILRMEEIQYNATIGKKDIEHLINMTPLSWGASSKDIQKALNFGFNDITVDLIVILGKKC